MTKECSNITCNFMEQEDFPVILDVIEQNHCVEVDNKYIS